MTSSRFDFDSTSKTLNISFLRFIERSGFQNHKMYNGPSIIKFSKKKPFVIKKKGKLDDERFFFFFKSRNLFLKNFNSNTIFFWEKKLVLFK